jgi:hypothetical protein
LACGALGIALAAGAAAAPPPGRVSMPAPGAGNAASGRLNALGSRATEHPASTLDLRAPAELPSERPEDVHPLAARSAIEPSLAPREVLRTRLEEELPSLGTSGTVRPMSRAEEIAQRFRREGLPVARLFETRSALVSLGLNPRGKPGIWLVQKLP